VIVLGFIWAIVLIALGFVIVYKLHRRIKDEAHWRADRLDVKRQQLRGRQIMNQIEKRIRALD
jgi:hypothetical protein